MLEHDVALQVHFRVPEMYKFRYKLKFKLMSNQAFELTIISEDWLVQIAITFGGFCEVKQ